MLPALLVLAGCTSSDPPTISFYLALQRADLDQIERHIQHGADLEAMDPDGNRPLHVVIRNGNWVAAEILLKHGAGIEAVDAAGRSPLQVALLSGRTQIAAMLVKRGAVLNADRLLREITLAGVSDRDVVDFLLKAGADLDHRDDDGKPPLILAIENDDRLMTKLLVSRGADVNAADAEGRRPLTVAEGRGNQAIIRYLHQNGAVDGSSN